MADRDSCGETKDAVTTEGVTEVFVIVGAEFHIKNKHSLWQCGKCVLGQLPIIDTSKPSIRKIEHNK